MFNPIQVGKQTRYSYARIKEVMEMPHLLDIQRNSYDWFKKEGLQEIFQDISPISDFTGNLELFFESFSFGQPKYSLEDCKKRDGTFSAPVRVKVKLLNKSKGEVKEQEVFLGDFPLMTDTGTFIINGAERVIVSQLVRSPGVYYDKTLDQAGRFVFSATIIPNRGAWIELEADANFNISVRIDRTRKMPITYFLRVLDFSSNDQILELFDVKFFLASYLANNFTNPKLLDALKKSSSPSIASFFLNSLLSWNGQNPEEFLSSLVNNFFDLDSKFDSLTTFKFLLDLFFSFDEQNNLVVAYKALVDQLDTDKKNNDDNKEKSLITLYSRLRPGEPPSADNALSLLNSLFFDPRRYDLAHVGRFKLNSKLGLNVFENSPFLISKNASHFHLKSTFGDFSIWAASPSTSRILAISDIVASINYLFALFANCGAVDDIDHLANRRVRAVGELLQNQFRIGMARMERVVKERMTTQDPDIVTPQNLINIRPVVAALKEFFGSSQLSQFMDQHNPLSELTHKRRLSALGPGGLSRERAGFEVRDVHISHYGRMCPIETPEGPNIGLIGSLSNFARINKFGFIESPYRRVDKVNRKLSSDVQYLSADKELPLVIAQANEPIKNDWFINQFVTARFNEKTSKFPADAVDAMDVSPKQVVSIASALIPFLEHDDANRALMGANMQRQAVPLLRTQPPLVGTGLEHIAAKHSGVLAISNCNARVSFIDASSICLTDSDGVSHSFSLKKFLRSNQGTCFNQRPIVHLNQKVYKGQPIADGPATHHGELALGANILVAYMPWEGFNYEDAILLNHNLIKYDFFSSIHIEEFQCDARDTKLGPEEVTRDIPNVSEDALANLDSDGIIAIGSDVQTGDILVGKVTPKGETELSAEERLLRAIFGEKAREVRDTSLRVPHGEAGKVVAVNIFTRDNNDEMQPGVNKQIRVYIAQKRKISVGDKMSGRHGNKGVVSAIIPQEDMPFLPDGTPVDIVLNPLGVPSRMNIGQILETHLGMAVRNIANIIRALNPLIQRAKLNPAELATLKQNPLLQKTIAGLLKLGYDPHKLDLLHLDDFQFPEPADCGLLIATPVFDGAIDSDLADTMQLAGMAPDGKTILYDGRTGEPFENRVTVGCVYMLKLHHLVDDKIHARSTGPYSLVTQQPLGGKAQFGGQRFGEMEVWALEAYGASYTLQEILTVKSDDVVGRVKAYEAIVKGQNIPEPGVPESFKVLIKELQSIALDIRVLAADSSEVIIKDDDDDDDHSIRKKAQDLDVDVGLYGSLSSTSATSISSIPSIPTSEEDS